MTNPCFFFILVSLNSNKDKRNEIGILHLLSYTIYTIDDKINDKLSQYLEVLKNAQKKKKRFS